MNKRFQITIAALISLCALSFVLDVGAEVFRWQDSQQIMHITNVRPEWWTDEMSQMDYQDIIPPLEPTPAPGRLVGDRENRKFHRPACEQIYNPQGRLAIPDEKIIWFDTADEAMDKGYLACDHCKPVKSSTED